MKKFLYGLLVLSLMFSISCGVTKKESGAASDANNMNVVTKGDLSVGSSANTPQKQEDNQKIIYNADLMTVAENLNSFSKDVNSKVNEYKGYIEREEIMEQNSIISVRIPTNRFNEFIAYVESISKLKNKRISSQNITDSYVDNDSRLKNLKAQENQILEIYKKANTVEDILKVQNELYRIRGEIESLEGRKKLWDNQLEYAAITISVEKLQSISTKSVGIISINEFFKSIKSGFVNSSLWIVLSMQKLIIFLVSNVLYIVIISLAAYFAYKNRNKIFKK